MDILLTLIDRKNDKTDYDQVKKDLEEFKSLSGNSRSLWYTIGLLKALEC